jgi:hypothetical protein
VDRLSAEFGKEASEIGPDIVAFVRTLNDQYLLDVRFPVKQAWMKLYRYALSCANLGPVPWIPTVRVDPSTGGWPVPGRLLRAMPLLCGLFVLAGGAAISLQVGFLRLGAHLWGVGIASIGSALLSVVAHEAGHVAAVRFLSHGAKHAFVVSDVLRFRTVHLQGPAWFEVAVALAGPACPIAVGALFSVVLRSFDKHDWGPILIPFYLHGLSYIPGAGDGDLVWTLLKNGVRNVERRITKW